MDHRELAQMIRRAPGRYYGRLPQRALAKVTGAAAVGQWEKAVEELIISLSAHAVPLTAEERQELRAILEAMHMSGYWADALRH
jgi:hypothetical protein